MKRISYMAAVEALKGIFNDPDEKDALTPQEIFELVGRDTSRSEQNKKWLQNRLTPLKDYGFVKPVYAKGPSRILDKVQLTPDGKKALRSASHVTSSREVTLESIARDIREFERQNPSILVEFRTILRREEDKA